ncbi:MAG TPA: cobalamin biosynthesis protein, partial [Candidatus Methanoperedens sp.]
LLDRDVGVLCVEGPKILLVGDDVTVMKKNGLVVGIGANKGVTKSEVIGAVNNALSEISASIEDVKLFASSIIKENETGMIEAAASFGKDIRFVGHELINSIEPKSVSKARALGLKGVCEPAALLLSEEKKLMLKKRIYGNVTIAIAR